MSKIRLIALDLDGTLLNHDKEVSAENRAAIARARAEGVRVILCTYRSLNEAAGYAKQAGCDELMVCEGGTMVANAATREIYSQRTIAPELIAKITELSRKEGLAVMYYAGGKIYTTEADKQVLFGGVNAYQGDPDCLVCVGDPVAYVLENQLQCTKSLSCGAVDALVRAREAIGTHPSVEFTSSGSDNFEALPVGVDKGDGLRRALDRLGLTADEVVAMGDAENDLPMLRAAGHPVAMGDAAQAVLDAAEFISSGHNQHGVAHAIAHYLGW